MSNQGEFQSGGVTFVNSLPVPIAGMIGQIFYLRMADGANRAGFYNVKEDGSGGYKFAIFGAGAFSTSGGNPSVYIYDIVHQPTTTNKAVTNKVTTSAGHVIDEGTSNTNLVRVFVRATGGRAYLPVVTVNTIPVVFSIDGSGPEFNGYADLNVGPSSGASYNVDILATHEDGPYDAAVVHVIFGPEINRLTFENLNATSSPYPVYVGNGTTVTQSELKVGDVVNVRVDSSPSSPLMTGIEFQAGGILASNVYIPFGAPTSSITFNLTCTRTGILSNATLIAKAHKDDGAYGDVYTSTTGSTGVRTMNVNNTLPSAVFNTVTYPVGQSALKDSESAVIGITIVHDGTIPPLFIAPMNQIAWTSTVTPYTVQRINGTYNVSTNNIGVTVYRGSNGTSASTQGIVNIAHIGAVINISEPVMRSSAAGNDSSVTISSNQLLYSAPTLVAPEGTWQGTAFTGSGLTWSRSLRIFDTNIKGTYSWDNLVAKNLAGIDTTIITGNATYTIAGFLSRQVAFSPAFSNEKAIGTTVTNPANLVVTDLGNTVLTHQANFNNVQFRYTITNGAGVISSTGTHVFICDTNVVSQNATGTYYLNVGENA